MVRSGKAQKARTGSTDKPQRYVLPVGTKLEETLIKLSKQLTGRDPTPEELERGRRALAQIVRPV